MKWLRWIVVLKNDPAGFYAPVSVGKLLVGFTQADDSTFLNPVWDSADPALYTFTGAKFIVSELRRVGYNTRRVPWLLIAICDYIKAMKNNPWKK